MAHIPLYCHSVATSCGLRVYLHSMGAQTQRLAAALLMLHLLRVYRSGWYVCRVKKCGRMHFQWSTSECIYICAGVWNGGWWEAVPAQPQALQPQTVPPLWGRGGGAETSREFPWLPGREGDCPGKLDKWVMWILQLRNSVYCVVLYDV